MPEMVCPMCGTKYISVDDSQVMLAAGREAEREAARANMAVQQDNLLRAQAKLEYLLDYLEKGRASQLEIDNQRKLIDAIKTEIEMLKKEAKKE